MLLIKVRLNFSNKLADFTITQNFEVTLFVAENVDN
jgi:hypothetical protein